jgi:hypothetical protein
MRKRLLDDDVPPVLTASLVDGVIATPCFKPVLTGLPLVRRKGEAAMQDDNAKSQFDPISDMRGEVCYHAKRARGV